MLTLLLTLGLIHGQTAIAAENDWTTAFLGGAQHDWTTTALGAATLALLGGGTIAYLKSGPKNVSPQGKSWFSFFGQKTPKEDQLTDKQQQLQTILSDLAYMYYMGSLNSNLVDIKNYYNVLGNLKNIERDNYFAYTVIDDAKNNANLSSTDLIAKIVQQYLPTRYQISAKLFGMEKVLKNIHNNSRMLLAIKNDMFNKLANEILAISEQIETFYTEELNKDLPQKISKIRSMIKNLIASRYTISKKLTQLKPLTTELLEQIIP